VLVNQGSKSVGDGFEFLGQQSVVHFPRIRHQSVPQVMVDVFVNFRAYFAELDGVDEKRERLHVVPKLCESSSDQLVGIIPENMCMKAVPATFRVGGFRCYVAA